MRTFVLFMLNQVMTRIQLIAETNEAGYAIEKKISCMVESCSRSASSQRHLKLSERDVKKCSAKLLQLKYEAQEELRHDGYNIEYVVDPNASENDTCGEKRDKAQADPLFQRL